MTEIADLERERERLIAVLKLSPDDVEEIGAVSRDLRGEVDLLRLIEAARRNRDQKKLN